MKFKTKKAEQEYLLKEMKNDWQIVEVISNSNIVINLPYSASNSFTGASIQYYYNNYQVKMKFDKATGFVPKKK